MKVEKQFIAEFKEQNAIVETSGSGTGTFKWRKYLDGIDMRYGHNTRRSAEMDRSREAKESYQYYAEKETKATCKCGQETTQEQMGAVGECWECWKKKNLEFA